MSRSNQFTREFSEFSRFINETIATSFPPKRFMLCLAQYSISIIARVYFVSFYSILIKQRRAQKRSVSSIKHEQFRRSTLVTRRDTRDRFMNWCTMHTLFFHTDFYVLVIYALICACVFVCISLERRRNSKSSFQTEIPILFRLTCWNNRQISLVQKITHWKTKIEWLRKLIII